MERVARPDVGRRSDSNLPGMREKVRHEKTESLHLREGVKNA